MASCQSKICIWKVTPLKTSHFWTADKGTNWAEIKEIQCTSNGPSDHYVSLMISVKSNYQIYYTFLQRQNLDCINNDKRENFTKVYCICEIIFQWRVWVSLMYLFFTRKNQVKTNRKLWYGQNLIITGWEMGIGHYQNRSIAPSSCIIVKIILSMYIIGMWLFLEIFFMNVQYIKVRYEQSSDCYNCSFHQGPDWVSELQTMCNTINVHRWQLRKA